MKVLIVDDETQQAEMLAEMLRVWGHQATAVGDGRQTLEALDRCTPDLILLDVFLPDTTAMELLPRIRSIHPDARVITLTGHSSRGLERRLRELGISYYMAKPFQKEELLSILDHLQGRPEGSAGRRAKSGSTKLIQLRPERNCHGT
jgi:DNA-binding response OmpR family regulator